MEPYVVILIGIVLIAVVAGIFFLKKRPRTSSEDNPSEMASKGLVAGQTRVPVQKPHEELSIRFEDLPTLTEKEEAALVEIKDQKLLARIDNAVPGALQVIGNAGAAQNAQQAIQNMGQLYQAIIPQGAKLVNAKDMDGAVRGFYRYAKGIQGQAHLVPVDGNPAQGLAAINVANAAMGAAAMVVGQYYMTQINNQLGEINIELDKIATFQDKEYQGRIYALVAAVQKCSQFQVEIVENEELRKLELSHLKGLEDECAKLLGQANLTLKEFEKKKGLDYSGYEKQVAEAQTWYQYQQILLEIMLKIDELTYALNLGQVSKENCYSMFLPYARQAEDSLKSLAAWHKETGAVLEIDLDANRRRRQGIEGFFMNIPALFNDDLHYKDMPKRTVSMISKQSAGQKTIASQEEPDLFREDVRLIAKDGKLYYLPETLSTEE